MTPQEPPPRAVTDAGAKPEPESYSHGSMETMWMVLAMITIMGVVAAIIARVCGGRHLGGNEGESDYEGCVDKNCRSCLDGGLPPSPPPPVPQPEAEETKAADK